MASERAKPSIGTHEQEHRIARSQRVASGTLACARCDAPVALTAGPVSPADWVDCPFCLHRAPVRDFLSLGDPTRPARVEVRVRQGPVSPGERHRRHRILRGA